MDSVDKKKGSIGIFTELYEIKITIRWIREEESKDKRK